MDANAGGVKEVGLIPELRSPGEGGKELDIIERAYTHARAHTHTHTSICQLAPCSILFHLGPYSFENYEFQKLFLFPTEWYLKDHT